MRWLVVSPYLPHSAIGHGGGTCVFDLCRNLGATHETRLLCFQRSAERGLERELIDSDVAVETVAFASEQDRGIARWRLAVDRARCTLRSWTRSVPYMSTKYERATLRRSLRRVLTEFEPDVVQVEYGFMAPYARLATELLRSESGSTRKRDLPRPVVLLNTHELVTLARLRQLSGATTGPERLRLRRAVDMAARFESQFPQWADQVLCVTDQDRVLLHAMTGAGNLRTVPLGRDVDRLPRARIEKSDPPRLLFVGSFGHPPNVDGAAFLLREVMPLLWQVHPDARVELVGAQPPESLRALGSGDDRVEFRGFVESLDESFDRAWVFVAPLRSGGGIKIKILEAMARGAAIVTSAIGAEGIDDEGTACVVANDATEQARAIDHLIEHEEERQRLAARARLHIERAFGWRSILQILAGCAAEAAERPVASARD